MGLNRALKLFFLKGSCNAYPSKFNGCNLNFKIDMPDVYFAK